MKTIKSCSLTYTEPPSNKEYHIQLVEDVGGYLVNFQYGRIGNALQTGTKTQTPVSLEEAEKIYGKLFREKTGKGYVEGDTKNDFESATPVAQKKEVLILPQLLNTIEDPEVYINDDNFLAQSKMDGERRMVIFDGDKVIGLNKKGTVVPLPESIITQAKDGKVPFIVDGEIIGTSLFLFDLLSLNEISTKGEKCVERIKKLRLLITGISNISRFEVNQIKFVNTAYTTDEKRLLFNTLKAENAEGIVFKLKSSPYTHGRPASGGSALKYKFYNTGTFIVANITPGKRSVGLEVVDREKKVFVGKVTIPPNKTIPDIGSRIEVQFLYVQKNGGCLFQPVFINDRSNECDETDCLISQLVYKSE